MTLRYSSAGGSGRSSHLVIVSPRILICGGGGDSAPSWRKKVAGALHGGDVNWRRHFSEIVSTVVELLTSSYIWAFAPPSRLMPVFLSCLKKKTQPSPVPVRLTNKGKGDVKAAQHHLSTHMLRNEINALKLLSIEKLLQKVVHALLSTF